MKNSRAHGNWERIFVAIQTFRKVVKVSHMPHFTIAIVDDALIALRTAIWDTFSLPNIFFFITFSTPFHRAQSDVPLSLLSCRPKESSMWHRDIVCTFNIIECHHRRHPKTHKCSFAGEKDFLWKFVLKSSPSSSFRYLRSLALSMCWLL